MIEVKPYEAALWPPDLIRQGRGDYLSGLTDAWLIYQSCVYEQGLSYMAVEDGKPLAAAGAWIVWPGVAQVWMIIIDQPIQTIVCLMRKLKRMLPEFCKVHKLRRLQAVINPNEETVKLVKFLNMKKEADLPGYGMDNHDWYQYGMVIQWHQ